MAVCIRLQRVGKKNRAVFRISVIEKRQPAKGKPIEIIGIYDPVKEKIDLDIEKFQQWTKNGALPSNTVKSLFKKIQKQKKVQEEIISAISSSNI